MEDYQKKSENLQSSLFLHRLKKMCKNQTTWSGPLHVNSKFLLGKLLDLRLFFEILKGVPPKFTKKRAIGNSNECIAAASN